MSKNISIHKAEFHKAFFVNREDNEEFLDDILSFEKFIYPVKDKNNIYLFDVENEILISDNLDLKSLKFDANTEVISFKGIPVEKVAKIAIPKKTRLVIFDGGDLMSIEMSKTQGGDAVWKKLINLINLYKFNETIDERILFEEELRYIYNKEIPLYINDIGLNILFQKIESSKITELTIGWVYFTEFDFKILSKIKQLQRLCIMYCYNDSIKWLPNNLSSLTIYGTTIQSMSEINLDLPKLVELDLSGNTLNNLDTLSSLPKDLEDLDLRQNLIRTFSISQLPKNLDYLNLSYNLIENDFFNQDTVHKSLKYLILSNNKLVISTSVLHRILEVFPNLEYLELLDNKTDGVPSEFLGDFENKDCLASVQYFLEGMEFKHKEGEIKITNEKKLNHFVEVSWAESSLPIIVILSDIQYAFSKHLKEIPSFNQYQNGLSCFIEHDNCELFLIINDKLNQVTFRVQSENAETVALYFHKYLQEINHIITFNSHKNVLPFIENSTSCDFLEDFYTKVFKINYKIKKSKILNLKNGEVELLVNNFSFDTNDSNDKGKAFGVEYENIRNIAFVLISGKSAYPFIVKDNIVTNSIKGNNKYHFLLTLREASDKESYIKGITNKYLNDFSLVETELFIDNNKNKALQCFINTNHFFVKNGNLCNINPNLDLVEKYLLDIEKDNKTLCNFKSENNFIKLKYVLK